MSTARIVDGHRITTWNQAPEQHPVSPPHEPDTVDAWADDLADLLTILISSSALVVLLAVTLTG